MKVTCSVYIATSVDGFIAGPDGDISWLEDPAHGPMGECGLSYEEFISKTDAIVMGRKTFDKVLTFDFWPYEGTPVIVLSNSLKEIPAQLEGKVRIMRGSPKEITEKLRDEGKTRLYIDGGITIQQFLKAGLIHELTITRIPVLLGGGIPLFADDGRRYNLKLKHVHTCQNGFVQFRYDVDQTTES